MSIAVSKDSLSNRRLYLKNRRTLISFSEESQLERVTLGSNLRKKSIEALKPDLVSIGDHALRLKAADINGHHPRKMSFTYTPATPFCLSDAPLLTFAISPYDGERDSRYFSDVAENKYFVEKPDPLLVSESYITVTLMGGGCEASRTVQLTNYGFNRIYANFAGEAVISLVEAIRFDYLIDEEVPAWQRVIKLDTVEAAMSVDFTFKGKGMEVLFETENGTVTHRDGTVTYTFAGESSLTLPDLTDGKNTVCDVFLPIKNTLVLRMDATVPALDLTVQFKTDGEDFFSADKQKTFALAGLDTPQTVYLNLSDCDKAVGRLTGIRLIPRASTAEAVTMRLWKVAFEQEKKIGPSAGRFLSCIADTEAESITLTCEIDPAYMGRELAVYDVFPSDIHPDLGKLECVARTRIESATVTLTAPLMRGNVTRIASQFLGAVLPPVCDSFVGEDWTPLAERTVIENWKDICGENPYAFDLPDHTVSVLDFGAKGDGFTDDTDAIQAAIDHVSNAGGGTVVIPGGVNIHGGMDMGRRFVVTNLYIRSFVELRVEEGAVLWQADDISYYKMLPRFGHNVSMTGVNWPANHTSGNMPLLYAFREEHFRLTGGGTVRMCDTESASEDGYFRYIGDNVCIGCCDRMHVCPIGIVECDTFEVSSLTVIRSSGVYMSLPRNHHGYIANMLMDEAKCTGADGMWPSASEGMRFTRILLNTNDDGLCLSANYNDPRDMLWCFTHPGTERSTRDIELSHSRFNCYVFTASAISFCVWGTDAPDLERVEVRNIHIFDTSLEGRVSIGGWTDNPYYGVFPFDNSETDDFSPVKDVRIHNCELRSPLGLGTLRILNLENDLGIQSPAQFERGDFLRRPAERNPDWRLGLSGWSYTTREAVDQIVFYGKACAVLTPVRGKVCDLWQGLYLTEGTHTMRFSYKASGSFTAFVRRAEDLTRPTGAAPTLTVIHEETIVCGLDGYLPGRDWQVAKITFTVPADGLYQLGIAGTLRETVGLYATDFSLDA